jgi:hypothetical protein
MSGDGSIALPDQLYQEAASSRAAYTPAVFQQIYDSAWHHPIAAWAAGVLTLAVLAVGVRRDRLRPVAALLALEIMLDAYCTGALTPLAPGAPLTTGLALVFVVVGDWRFFFLVERARPPRGILKRPSTPQAAMAALGWALVVPLLTLVGRVALPSLLSNDRVMFLAYELALLPMVAFVAWRARRWLRPGAARTFLLRLCAYEAALYALWALGDLTILVAGDVGFLPRLVANLMYYAGFVPFVVAAAPSEEEGRPPGGALPAEEAEAA